MIGRIMTIFDHVFTAISVAALAALTLLVVADVVLRYGWGNPIFFAHDLVVLYLTPAVFFFGYGPTYWRNEHLSVDVLTHLMPSRMRALSLLISALIGIGMFSLLFWISWDRAWTSFMNDEWIASIIPWPAYASYAIVPIGSAAMILACAVRLTESAVAVITGRTPDAAARDELSV